MTKSKAARRQELEVRIRATEERRLAVSALEGFEFESDRRFYLRKEATRRGWDTDALIQLLRTVQRLLKTRGDMPRYKIAEFLHQWELKAGRFRTDAAYQAAIDEYNGVRPDERVKTCEVCGRQFRYKRVDARFCGQRCRQRIHRVRAGLDDLAKDLTENLLQLLDEGADGSLIDARKAELREVRQEARAAWLVPLPPGFLERRQTHTHAGP